MNLFSREYLCFAFSRLLDAHVFALWRAEFWSRCLYASQPISSLPSSPGALDLMDPSSLSCSCTNVIIPNSCQCKLYLQCTTIHYNAIQYNTIQYNAMHYNTMQNFALDGASLWCCIVLLCIPNIKLSMRIVQYTLHTIKFTTSMSGWWQSKAQKCNGKFVVKLWWVSDPVFKNSFQQKVVALLHQKMCEK